MCVELFIIDTVEKRDGGGGGRQQNLKPKLYTPHADKENNTTPLFIGTEKINSLLFFSGKTEHSCSYQPSHVTSLKNILQGTEGFFDLL